MSVLLNPRHERFALGLAAGKTADDAYAYAGFKPNRGNATRLKANDSIRARVAELSERLTEKASVSKAWVIERLVENANRAMQAEAVKDNDGSTTGEYRYEGSVANRALELVGKELGMFVDRKDIRFQSLSELTQEQIDTFLAELGAGEASGADRGTSH